MLFFIKKNNDYFADLSKRIYTLKSKYLKIEESKSFGAMTCDDKL